MIGTFLARDGVVAYWSALNLHGLTEQFPNSIFIQTSSKRKAAHILGTTYQFVKVDKGMQTGANSGANPFTHSGTTRSLFCYRA
ncbi:MAG: hypothetical protein LBN06_03185 [Prevotellaceae bacterium]|nr:hypothetical protein [Prevotellaceae bacterium]